MVKLQAERIGVETIVDQVRSDSDGAVALFLGTVRNHNLGREVLHLEYEAYPEMALEEMQRIEGEALQRFEISDVVLVHRTGRVELGEASVVCAASAAHRAAAMEACRFVIDALKVRVPIWKKEFFSGGEVWIEGAGQTGDGQA
jgi:molybdopterin synthase catalytic subunit